MEKLKKFNKQKLAAFIMAVVAVVGVTVISVGAYSATDKANYKYTAAILTTSSTSDVISGNYPTIYFGAASCAKETTTFKFDANCMCKRSNSLFFKTVTKQTVEANNKAKRKFSTSYTVNDAQKWKLKLSSSRACYGDGWIATYKAY